MKEFFFRHTDIVKKLTVNIDRDRYYFGMNEIFSRHTDIVKKLLRHQRFFFRHTDFDKKLTEMLIVIAIASA